MPNPTRSVTVDGQVLTDRLVRQGLRTNIVAGSLGMAWFAMAMGIPLTMLLEALGASGVQIGLLVTVQQLAMLVQIPASAYAESLPSRKIYWAGLALGHRVLWFIPAMLPLLLPDRLSLVTWAVIVVVTLSALLAHGCTASWYSWMADLVPTAVSGRFWGLRQSLVMMSYLVSMGVAGFLLDLVRPPSPQGGSFVGFALVFALGALLGIADILVHLRVPEPRPRQLTRQFSLMSRLIAPLRSADFRWLTFCMGVWYLSVGLVGSFGIVYLKRDFHATYTQLSVINIAASLGTIAAGIPIGYLTDRIGARTLGAIFLAVAPAFGFFWFLVGPDAVTLSLPLLGTLHLPQPIAMFTLTNLFAGAMYGGIGVCQISLASSLSPERGRTMAMAVHWSIIGLLAAAGPIIGGKIMDYVQLHPLPWTLPSGSPVSFFHLLVIGHIATAWLICVPMMLKVRTRGGDMPVNQALSRLRVGNPLRAFTDVYNIYQFVRPTSSVQRAQAARRLGEHRTAVAVTDLIERLEDPAAEVREEAVLALGKIGSPEAVGALIAKLEDRESDLAPLIARALRTSKAPESVDVLLQRLGDSDRETQSESARALGAIGDQRATGSLLELIRQTDDSKVISASSEALACLGEIAAIYEIIPHLKATRNAVLKRSMAVAVGDLLGEPGEFYRILSNEMQSPGKEVERMLRELRRTVRRGPAEEPHVKLIVDLIDRLQDAFDEEDTRRCADLLFDLGIAFAALIHGIDSEGNETAFIEDLIWRDEHFGVGVWFLAYLRSHWDDGEGTPPDLIDILIGLYFLYSLRLKFDTGKPPKKS